MVQKFQVFRKASPNKKITTILTNRNYAEHNGEIDPIDGLIMIDPLYVGDFHVYVQLVMRFFFGNDTDVNNIDHLVKTLNIGNTLVYPPPEDVPQTELQTNLISRLGNFAFPFHLQFPKLGSPSYVLQKGWEDEAACMGIEYSVMAYCGYDADNVRPGSSSVMTVMRHQSIPQSLYEVMAPRRTITRSFKTCSGNLNISAALNKNVYAPEEDINIFVNVESKVVRDIKKLKIKVVQISEAPIFKNKQRREQTVMKSEDAVFITYGTTFNNNYTIKAKLPNRGPTGLLFVKGTIENNVLPELATSTVINDDVLKKDLFGITVSYVVRVKCTCGSNYLGEAVLDVPFILDNFDKTSEE